MPPERTQDSTPKQELKPYSHPKSKIQFYEEEDPDTVTLISVDGKAFKVFRQILIVNSLFWKDILSLPAKKEPIKLEEDAVTVYAVLHLMQEIEVDISGEPDPAVLDDVKEGANGETEMDTALYGYRLHMDKVSQLLVKWQMKKQHVGLMKTYLHELVSKWPGHMAGLLYFSACQLRWEDLGKSCLKHFGSVPFSWEPSEHHTPWASTNGLPFWMPDNAVAKMGESNHRKLVQAVVDSFEVEKGKIKVNWDRVSEIFTLEEKK